MWFQSHFNFTESLRGSGALSQSVPDYFRGLAVDKFGFDGLLVLEASVFDKQIALCIFNTSCFEDTIFESEARYG